MMAPTFALDHANKATSTQLVDFDIPPEPLDEALYIYSKTTGIEIVADDALISGRRSAAVKGTLAPATALRHLLAASRLEAHLVDAGTFVLTQSELALAQTPAMAEPSRQDPFGPYSVMLQDAVTRALCSNDETRPGNYKFAARLWIGTSGVVERVTLLAGTGDTKRDAALARLFDRLAVGHAPPPGLPQPANVLIMPRPPEQTGDCTSVERASAAP